MSQQSSTEHTTAAYLAETYFIDWAHPQVGAFVERHTNSAQSQEQQALDLYVAVRDKIRYNPYAAPPGQAGYKASYTIEQGEGFCVPKAIVYCAVLRAIGVPARLGYADVRNHLATQKLLDQLGTDIFYFHGYTDVFLNQKWVKATPAFSRAVCRAFRVDPLEFNGREDSVFHEFDKSGDQRFMEYLHDYGTYADFPYKLMHDVFREKYPDTDFSVFNGDPMADFEADARAEQKG